VVEGETVVLDRQHGLVHQLNPTATYIWERCDGQATVEDLAAQLTETFDVAYEMALQDVARVTAHFRALQLLDALPEQAVGSPSQAEEALYAQQGYDHPREANEPQRSD